MSQASLEFPNSDTVTLVPLICMYFHTTPSPLIGNSLFRSTPSINPPNSGCFQSLHPTCEHFISHGYHSSHVSSPLSAPPPPLLPIIRDNINLTATDIGNAGIAAVSGAVFARVAMGTACDLFGPRLASSSLILLTAPAVFLTSIVNSPATFLLVRFFTGFSLATFVSTQFWMSSMFSPNVVGTANGLSGGWGNLGGGATQLIMPLVYSLIHTNIGSTKFTAWRIAFFIPALFQTLSAYGIFFLGQDLPDGNYVRLENPATNTKITFHKSSITRSPTTEAGS
ncbi:hypothetical protein R6Q59_034742 [Mikania micrantha]